MEPKSIFVSRQENHCTSQSSRKLINSAVKTPALLFYKPSQNTGKKSKPDYDQNYGLPTHQQSRNEASQISCENHPNILAKYFSKTDDEQQQIFYCDKCAHLLKDQGFNITPISTFSQSQKKDTTRNMPPIKNKKSSTTHSFPYPQRQHQIKDFMNNLTQYREELSQNSSQVREILISSQQFYGQQIQEINEYFQSIIQSLQLQKNKCYNHILQQRQNAQKQTRNLVRRLAEGEKQINSMMADIEENLDSVYSISWQNYQLVMDTFTSRLHDVNNLLSEIREKGIADVQYRKIQFAGVPESINSLSEIIIQNSYGSINYADGSLLLTEGSSDSFKRAQELQQNSANIPDNSIFQKLRTDRSLDEVRNFSNMMFSFDGQKMRELQAQNPKTLQQNNFNCNRPIFEDNDIKLRKNRNFGRLGVQQNGRVQGVKQVEQIDVLVMDDDDLFSQQNYH